MNTQETFKYYTHQEAEQHAYYSIPKELFTNSKYKNISTDAKLLYGLLRDRNQLSIKNNWVDKDGHIFIIFTRDEVMNLLDVAKPKASNLFKELNEVELIREIKQGLNKPNIIYVGKIIPENKPYELKLENPTSGSNKNLLQGVMKTYSSNTDINNTDFSNSVSQSDEPEGEKTDRQTDNDIQQILENAQVDLYSTKPFIESVVTKLYKDSQIPYILKMGLSHKEIQTRLKLLNNRHIDTALIKIKGCKTNKEIYFMKCLLTAIVELELDDYIIESDD